MRESFENDVAVVVANIKTNKNNASVFYGFYGNERKSHILGDISWDEFYCFYVWVFDLVQLFISFCVKLQTAKNILNN